MDEPTSPAVLAWWITLSVISVGNIAIWLVSRRRLARDRATISPTQYAEQRRLLWLAGVYTAVCAFRSFLPRADVQRICLVDTWFSTVLVGRFVATIAEVSMMAAVAQTFRGASTHLSFRAGVLISRLIVPAIVIAETCSWYAVITRNFLGNTCEESIWGLTSLVLAVTAGYLSLRATGRLRTFLRLNAVFALGHAVFEATIDVPMYVTRLIADQRAGRAYAGLSDGLHDLATRWVVTYRWSDWHDELAWMGLYFSVAVWVTLALVWAPRLWHAPRKP
jgi:hypothetical protein